MPTKLCIGIVALAVASACTDTTRGERAVRAPGPTQTTPSLAPSPTTLAAAPHPVSLQALAQKKFDGRGLTLGRVLARNDAYTRYFVTYKSGSLTISGIMNVPAGNGPFPVLVLCHGYIDPDIYANGQGLRREQDYLARRGYVVLHTDYRNHAQSSDDPNAELGLRLGYTEDVINAVEAIKGSSLSALDKDRVGLLCRSMGGGVALNVAVVRPDLVDAIALFAPVSSDVVDNFDRWIRRSGERRALAERIAAAYGSPEETPHFWADVSPRTYFSQIKVPIVIHHGTDDESVPIAWTHETVAALEALRKNVRLYVYEGEHHAFGPQWPNSMRRTRSFFARYLT